MEVIKTHIGFLLNFALILNALLFIYHTIVIFNNKITQNPLFIFALLYIHIIIILYGIVTRNYFLIVSYLLTFITYSFVVLASFTHKKHTTLDSCNMSAEQILEQMPGHIYWKNNKGVLTGCNTQNWKDFGLKSLADFVGITDYDLFPKAQADKHRELDIKVMEVGQAIIAEEESTHGDGLVRVYLSHKIPLRDKKNKIIGILGVSLDITDTKKKEIERLNLLERIIAEIPGHIFWKNKEGIFLGCNNQQAKTLGLSSWHEIIGKTTYDVVWQGQPEKERREQAFLINDNDRKIMETGISQVLEEPLILPDGEKAIYLSKKTPLRNDKEEIIGIIGISFDITEKKKAEQILFETQRKLESMTLISASIAHEIRTPLSAFNIATNNIKVIFPRLKEAYLWAKERQAPIKDITAFYLNHVEEKLNVMEQEVKAASTFIDITQMNTNPSLDLGNPKILSISNVIDEALSRYPFMGDQKKLITWQRNIHTDFLIQSDELIIIHVLFNLIKNALYYVAKAGRGNIQIWLEPGNPINKLYFKDTGTGIPASILPHIFERFFSTTDKSAHPAGIGLSFCKQVMESLRGSIVCESIEGEYVLFTLSFSSNIDP